MISPSADKANRPYFSSYRTQWQQLILQTQCIIKTHTHSVTHTHIHTHTFRLQQLVYEKEKRLRVIMKMHGLPDTAYWLVSYVWNYMVCVLTCTADIVCLYCLSDTACIDSC